MAMMTLKKAYLDLKAGQPLYDCVKCTYGLEVDESRMLGELCVSVSMTPDGGYPFRVVPVSLIEGRIPSSPDAPGEEPAARRDR